MPRPIPRNTSVETEQSTQPTPTRPISTRPQRQQTSTAQRRIEAVEARRNINQTKAVGSAILKAIRPIVIGLIIATIVAKLLEPTSVSDPDMGIIISFIIIISIGILSGICRGWETYKDEIKK